MIIDKEFEALIPKLSKEEFKGLEENIILNGCLDALKVWGDILIDGHNRYNICTKNNIKFNIQRVDFKSRDDVLIWIIKNQLDRRNISDFVRFELIDRQSDILREIGRKNQCSAGGDKKSKEVKEKSLLSIIDKSDNENKVDKNKEKKINNKEQHDTRKEIAKTLGWSSGKVAQAKKVKEKANEEDKEKLRKGETSINKVYKEIKKEEKQKEREEKIKAINEVKKNKDKQNDNVLPNLVLADPPWLYEHSRSNSRKIENHYETVDIEGIKQHKPRTQDNCVLFMWATAPKLTEAIEVLQAWDFKYKTCAIWNKQIIGMGYWFRGQHELLLVGVKGKVSPPDINYRVPSLFTEKRSKHSKKPDCVYDWIERAFYDSIKLEMYCREPRTDWLVWGNEV